MIDYLIPLPEFKRNYKKARKKHFNVLLIRRSIHLLLIQDYDKLRRRCHDHALHGDMQGYRELHILKHHNLLLLYQIQNYPNGSKKLVLIKLGSHDDLYK